MPRKAGIKHVRAQGFVTPMAIILPQPHNMTAARGISKPTDPALRVLLTVIAGADVNQQLKITAQVGITSTTGHVLQAILIAIAMEIVDQNSMAYRVR